MTISWTKLRPHLGQSKLWRSTSQFDIVYAGRGSGKTELAKRKSVRFLNVKKRWEAKYFYGMPTYSQAKRVAWYDILNLIPKTWIKDISLSEMCITTIYKSKLYVVGMDSPERIEGIQWDGGVLDERSDIKEGVFARSVVPSLAHKNGWLVQTGVPKRFGVGAAEFRRLCLQTTLSNCQIHTWPSSTILSQDSLDTYRSLMTEEDFKEQYESTWQNIGGKVFYAFDYDIHSVASSYDSSLPICVASDYNVNPMSWCLLHDIDGRLVVFDELFIRNANTPSTLDELWSRYQYHKSGFEFYGDATAKARKTSAEFTDLAHIKNDLRFDRYVLKKMFYTNSNPSQADRFAACNAMFRNGFGQSRIDISPKCDRLLNDLDVRSYKKDSRELNDSGDVGHMSDALGYLIYQKYPVGIRINQGKQRASLIKQNGSPKVFQMS